ncbi:hypothetical protein COEREDRAFT_84793 [Coemansia reversa NRRL 1564]|uniref:F-box domain-containing protein n=1 Tax=Coemansia reversa (strain ATCC 12441 / NRRL 1564) TaxID=763665 RepID=A0A2G5BIL6_COERN|nr:hypothetical protein COEREDRAFT_84793 [Coemansia reversa NRRL 1564]|eukprot:PIA18839.1 hypothetical protein COEREDRAFT_84793 [Coemansia reversa NRRL 1564]
MMMGRQVMLPDDILVLIFESMSCIDDEPQEAFKKNLVLLNVCQAWRHAAMPIAYREVFVHCETSDGCDYATLTEIYNTQKNLDTTYLVSNAQLVLSADCIEFVKVADISVCFHTNPLLAVDMVVDCLKSAANKWQNIRQLAVTMQPSAYASYRLLVDIDCYKNDITRSANEFCNLMPHVRRLGIQGANTNILARSLCDHLAGCYADQLNQLDCRHPIIQPDDVVFKELTDMSIDFDYEYRYGLPRVSAETLVSLKISNASAGHSWSAFSHEKDPTVINFPSLRFLDLTYNVGGGATLDSAEVTKYKHYNYITLNFPSLKVLYLTNMTKSCPLLQNAVLPSHMERLSITASTSVFEQASILGLPQVKHISLTVGSRARRDDDVFIFVRQILAQQQKSENTELIASNYRLPVHINDIEYISLTCLRIKAPISVDTMLAFIKRLRKLSSLSLYGLALDNIQSDITIPEVSLHSQNHLEPLDTNIKEISICYITGGYRSQEIVQVSAYLMLKIPSLRRFAIVHTLCKPLLDIVATYTPMYPHLENLRLQLDEYEECFYAGRPH